MASGIYMIQSISEPWKIYIGSTVDFQVRWMVHTGQLKTNSHPNQHLQRYVLKHGFDNLIFLIIKICPRDELLKQEQKYIDILQPSFNICLTAGSRLNVPHSPTTKLKISRSTRISRKPSRGESLRGRFVKQGL